MNNSLASARNYRPDAFLFAPQTPFVPENIKLGDYTFLSWVRSGLAVAVNNPDGAALRASATIHVTVQGDGVAARTVDKSATLRGPGDVIGLDAAEIVRRVPAPNAFNVEESFLAQIEFNRPELPWLFSPHAPDSENRVRPWLALIVCELGRATVQPGPTGLPQQVVTRMSELQPLEDAWAFAHAQVAGPSDGTPSVQDRLTEDYALVNLSRILCPRKLDPGKSYMACLVPVFDCGVKAGLGSAEPGTLDFAWTRGADDGEKQITLPLYDHWRFSIGPAGDFESLAEKIVPIDAPWQIGRRMIDTSNPRGGMAALADAATGKVQVLRCALFSPAPIGTGAAATDTNVWTAATRDALRTVIDTSQGASDLPRVAPRVYAQYQRAQRTIGKVFGDPANSVTAAGQDWFADLNTAPLHRIVAGVGARVVQKDREPLMQSAWQQVGDINAVNRVLTSIQFGRFIGQAVLDRHFATLGLGEMAQMMRGVQGKIRVSGSAATVHGLVARSRVPPAAMTGAFRRATRSRGPSARLLANAAALRQLVSSGDSFKDMRLTYVEPDGISSLSHGGIAAISAAVLAKTFGVSPQAAAQTAVQRLAPVPGLANAADRMLAPAENWRVPSGAIDLASLAASQIQQGIDAAPVRLANDGARAEAVAPLLVGIANGATGEVARKARLGVQRINDRLVFAPVRAVGAVLSDVGRAAVRTSSATSRRAVW